MFIVSSHLLKPARQHVPENQAAGISFLMCELPAFVFSARAELPAPSVLQDQTRRIDVSYFEILNVYALGRSS